MLISFAEIVERALERAWVGQAFGIVSLDGFCLLYWWVNAICTAICENTTSGFWMLVESVDLGARESVHVLQVS